MQQFQFEYKDVTNLRKELGKIRQWCKAKVISNILFHIYSASVDCDKINEVCSVIKDKVPKAMYVGSTSYGNILNGQISDAEIVIVCSIFEFPDTKVSVLQYELTEDSVSYVTEQLISAVNENSWVNAVGLLVTIRVLSMTGFCDALKDIREGVQIFGGGAFNPNINDNGALVFSNVGECSKNAVVFVLYGGEDLHIETMRITGWKPLGRTFLVTKSHGNILYELDNIPAYDVYYKYLNIQSNEHFFYNTLEFPFYLQLNGIPVLRAPIASNPDGSLTMTSDMAENVTARIAYGDPRVILEIVNRDGRALKKFQPEGIQVFSCAARRTFWGRGDISKETLPFQSMAPTFGFYTSSEFLRTGSFLNQHNVTLVLVAMREGALSVKEEMIFEMAEENYSGHVSMISRLATFIDAVTDEYRQINRELSQIAIRDPMTGFYNRAEIQKRIANEIEKTSSAFSLVMIDIDNFKFVNDTYGHAEGDRVIIGLSDRINEMVHGLAKDVSVGRWGGEEFMILLPKFTSEAAEFFAEKLRKRFAYSSFPEVGQGTISLGVTERLPSDTVDSICVRVDNALYKAKRSGKNTVVVLQR